MLRDLLDKLPWVYLIPLAIVFAVMPVSPEPHLVEKLRMLFNGQLHRPIDIFDLVLHGGLLLVVAWKLLFLVVKKTDVTEEK